jgi:DNA-binding transcriptional MerR regulator
MDMLTLAQLAEQSGLAPAQLRVYRDTYLMFIPTVRVGQLIGYPSDAITVISQIHHLTGCGLEPDEITAELERQYPVTVISAQPLGEGEPGLSPLPAMTSLLREVNERYAGVRDEIAQLRQGLEGAATEERTLQIQASVSGIASTTAAQIAPLAMIPSELGQIRQAISLLATRVDRTGSAALAYDSQLTSTLEAFGSNLSSLKHEVAQLRAERAGSPQPLAVGSELLAEDVASLTLEVTELRSERLQMMQVMSDLQRQLAIVHRTVTELPLAPPPAANGHGHGAVVTLANHAGAKAANTNGNGQHPTGNSGPGDLRTPRRLGHQIR